LPTYKLTEDHFNEAKFAKSVAMT